MIQVIDGVEYDTEVAVAFESWSNGRDNGDPRGWKETLYRSKDGKHSFLLGSGNAETAYRMGPEIIPLTGKALAELYQRKYGCNFG
jgi:hypothetical protein